jgi:hypothetical protein
MARYRWETKTAYVNQAGTDANVFISLSGDKATLKETEINDPDSSQDWEKGDINHGLIETADLGWIKTGTLKHDGWGAGPDWMVEYVKITNDEDGREWLAGVNAELKANNPFRLVFKNTSRGQFDEMQRQKELEVEQREREQSAEDAKLARERKVEDAKADTQDWKAASKARMEQLKSEMERAKVAAEEQKLREELARMRGGSTLDPTMPPPTTTPTPMPTGGSLKTYEVFGVYNGRPAPLTQAVNFDRATGKVLGVNAGYRVMATDSPSEGFGLAGTPGRWSSFVTQSPLFYGLDPDRGILAWDGSRGQVLNASYLLQLFGDWRQAVY